MSKSSFRPPHNRSTRAWYAAVFAAAAVLYVASCAPGPVWQDSGLIQWRVYTGDIEGGLGLALSHPLFYIIAITANQVPLGEPAYRVNVTTALLSAFAVANLFLFLLLWFRSVLPAAVGACSLALSHTFWRHAAVPETYNLTVALLMIELTLLLLYARTGRTGYLYTLALVNGLGIANHMLASIPLACYLVLVAVLFFRRRLRAGQLAAMAALWVVGAAPYEYLIIKDLIVHGDPGSTVSSALFGVAYKGDVLNTSLSASIVKENLMWMALNFPTPNILLVLPGAVALRRLSPKRWFGSIVLAVLVLLLVFAFRYTVVDRYSFFIPFYSVVAILIGAGAQRFISRRRRGAAGRLILLLSLLTIPAYIAAPALAERLGVPERRNIPYRDDYTYFLRPWRTGYRGAERFAAEALDAVKDNAVILADSTTAPPLLYVQAVHEKRPDVDIVSPIVRSQGAPEPNEQTIDALLAERPVYVVSIDERYRPALLSSRCHFEPAGVLFRALPVKSD